MFLVVVALVFGANFVQLLPRSVADARSLMGIVYFAVVYTGNINQVFAMPLLFQERVVFYREVQSGFYSTLPYAAAASLVELPYLLLSSLLFSLVFHPMISAFAYSGGRFESFWLAYFAFLSMTTYFGQMLAAWLPSMQVAQVVGSIVSVIWCVLCGFMIPVQNIPQWAMWLYYASPLGYAFTGIMGSQFGCSNDTQLEGGCPRVETAGFGTQVDYNGSNPTLSQFLYDELRVSQDSYWEDVKVLLLFCLIFNGMTFWGLTKVKHMK